MARAQQDQSAARRPVRMTVVVAPDCPTCAAARALAREMQARFPALEVAVLDLAGGAAVPPPVVATPTYLLDGAVIALGNPRREALAAQIAARLRPAPDRPLMVYGTARCGDCRRVRRVLDARGVHYAWVDIDADPAAAALVRRVDRGRRAVPTLVFPDGATLTAPAEDELLARLAALPGATVPRPAGDDSRRWRGAALVAGLAGAVLANACSLPLALALALGLSLSTVATASQLMAYERYLELAGLVGAAVAAWWLRRRCQATARLPGRAGAWVPLYVAGAFALGFALLNLGVIPLLEQAPWLPIQH